MTFRLALRATAHKGMARQSVTVGVEPELLRWFRDEAHLPLGQAVNG
jgi:hypothetical protein